jgi:two-component system cell cycle sensor histidine kinase/response regulator CckA
LFSRKVETEKKPVELNQTVEQIRRILERTIPKMIDIELHLGGRLWNVNVDPVQIEQILLNLGTNAADAMPDGGKLVIETENIVLDKEKSK